jgi:hypothetical protein
MTTLDEKIIDTSVLIEKQLPSFVRESSPKFVSFLTSYYESQEVKYNSLDIVENLIDYYNIGHYSPSKLKETTKLTSTVGTNSTTIGVFDTTGFPESNGYIQIDDEIIFYKSKTKTQFLDCVRSTGAFILEKFPTSNVTYKNSGTNTIHPNGTLVYNISYQFAIEFLNKIKNEISPNIPEVLAQDLNISSFLKNISSFYRAKGTKNSHKLLFRILFNEKRVKLKLQPAGTGAIINILNYSGDISAFEVFSSGSGYYYELVNGQLQYPPLIDIIGSGTGVKNPTTSIADSVAKMVVTKMTTSGGIFKPTQQDAIPGVQVVNKGTNYVGPITARVRDRNFTQDQTVKCVDENNTIIGTGKVYSWSDTTRELILYQISGYFLPRYSIIGEGGETPKAKVSEAYPLDDLNTKGNPSVEVISVDPNIELPKHNVIKASSASLYRRKVIRCELISGSLDLSNVKLLELVQKRDLTYKIQGATLEISEIQKLDNNNYEFELGSNLDYKKIFLPPSTTITQTSTIQSNSYTNITVSSTANFPTTKGKLFIDGRLVEYQSKTSTQFVNCKVIRGSAPLEVYNGVTAHLYGRNCLADNNVATYCLFGYVNGDRNSQPIEFRIVSVPSKINITDGGSLYTSSIFKFNSSSTNTILKAKKYNFGSVDEVIIENAGINYRVNDKLVIDNTFTYGAGFSAYVSEIQGVPVVDYDFISILGIDYIRIITSQPHNISTNDVVYFNSSINKQKVFSVESLTAFLIPKPKLVNAEDLSLSYTTTSKSAQGSIVKIAISNKGNNYKKLPEIVTIDSINGKNALLQLNSKTIGKISSIECESISGELIGDKTTQFSVKFPSTSKIKNNYQISKIEVISGGNNYRPTDKIKVNGVIDNNYQFKIITSSGIITNIEILYGGNNLSEIPSITLESDYGTGAILEAKLNRKLLLSDTILKLGSATTPTATIKVLNFDAQSSVLEFEKLTGTVTENTTIYYADGSIYGTIFSVNVASAYANISTTVSFPHKFLDNYGFLNDTTQRIHDSNYYQDWSYTIASNRNTSEWKNEVIQNTHPSGFKLFGKNLIENQKSLFNNSQDVLSSSVIFKASLSNIANLNLKLSECNTQKILIDNYLSYSVGEFVYGNISKSIGIIKSISESYIEVYLFGSSSFIFGEYVFEVDRTFATTGVHNSNNVLVFYSGILQQPITSYYIVDNNFIPFFEFSSFDQIIAHRLTNNFTTLDFTYQNNTLKLYKDKLEFNSGSAENLLISINGVVQAPTFTVNGNIVTLDTNLKESDSIFVLHQQNLKKITFTGSGANYTLNYSPDSSCKLLVFANSVYQSQLVTDFSITGNQLVLSEPLTDSNIFGWYIDETINCYALDTTVLLGNKILHVDNCAIKKLTQYVESAATKNPESLYQITKNLIDGTVYADPDNTTVYGFDTRFKYSNPEYSTSYVEVLNEISFNGSTTTFNLRYADGAEYTPVNGKNTLLVYVNNQVLDHDQYSISGSTIIFNQAYSASSKCTIIDFNSKYLANNTSTKSALLDRLNVSQNGTRKTFNLSDRGVPHYAKNVEDLFTIKNGVLKRPDSQTHSVSANKITFVDAPTASDNIKLCYFNRQLDPAKTKNVILDSLICFDGVRSTFPISINGILFSPISSYHLFVIRNGVYQKPITDYTISGSNITFTTAPQQFEDISIYYSYDGLNQNFKFDNLRLFNNSQTRFGLTSNYVSTTVFSSSHLQVVKNGAYQYPNIDYTIGGPSDARYIDFVAAPSTTDQISIINYKSQDLVDITNRFTQINTNTLQYTSQSPSIDTTTFLIYVNGILQVGNAWTFDTNTNTLVFAGFVSLSLDEVQILGFQTEKRSFDPITISSGVFTYNLQVNSSTITTNLPLRSSDLVISINGVEQIPASAYTVSGSTITLINSNLPVGSVLYAYQIGSSSFDTEIIDYLDDNYLKSTYKLQVNYKSFNPPATSDVFVLRNGVAQNPGQDFTTGNGYITFDTNITPNEDVYISYRHGSNEIAITNISGTTITLATSVSPSDYNNVVVHLNGVPQFNGVNYFIAGNTIILPSLVDINSIFVIKYAPITFIDPVEDCPNGFRTKFRLFYNQQNIIASDILQNADILVSVNEVIQYPGVQYTISANRAIIEFATPPQSSDQIFMVKMNSNELIILSPVSGSNTVYDLSQSFSNDDQENLVVFSNNTWKFNELNEYNYTTSSRITLSSANTSTYIFGIKFAGTFHLLDQINTPYNGINTKFNLFFNQENFMPPGTLENDMIPSESSLIVIKNGKILDPGVEYTLQGDIKSQIQFSTAPIAADAISVQCVGTFLKLLSITSGFGAKIYNLKTQTSVDYYPNADIERPRPHENQILVIRDGNIQSPLYDYYIDNNKIVFTSNVTASKLVVLDFKGTAADVAVNSVSYQINVNDKIQISGEQSERTITQVISPTVVKTTQYTGPKPSGFVGSAAVSGGKVTSVSITNGGSGYRYPAILRTLGVGYSAKATASVNNTLGGAIQAPVIIQYPGYNQYQAPSVVATSYAYSYTKMPLSTSNVRIGTKLSSNILPSAEIIPVANAQNFEQSDVAIAISSVTGSGATFRPFISKGRIRKVEVLTSGIGYDDRDAEVIVVGGGGVGCILELVLDSMGRVTSIIVRNSGEGYDTYRVIIDNDIIEYTNIVSNQLIGCTRAITAAAHNQNDIVYYDKFI